MGATPGFALGVVQNNELIFSKGYGTANLDYKIPLSDSSAFYIGSMAKQFTAAALLILEAEGKLNFDQEVSDYLKDFPEYEEPITVAHLVHHTSGIRETNSLQLFQGIDRQFEEVFTTEDLYDLVIAQNDVNFTPGQEYRYSSGGYAVLAKIVEAQSRMPFREFLQERIFNPLGMEDTFVNDDHNEIIKNRVVSYWPTGQNSWERRSLIFEAYGDGGIITTVRDLAKWDAAFYRDELGVVNFANKMYEKGVLANGDSLNYAMALNVTEYQGQPMVNHNGGMLGFRVDMVRFPKLHTSIILMANVAYTDPSSMALQVADYLLEDDFIEDITKERQDPVTNFTQARMPTLGHYWTDQSNFYVHVSASGDSLFWDFGDENNRVYLVPNRLDVFKPSGVKDIELRFDNMDSSLDVDFNGTHRSFRLFNPQPPTRLSEVLEYTGTYTSSELQSTYSIQESDDKIFLQINDSSPIQLFPTIENGVVWNGKEMVWIGFGEVKFQKSELGQVEGLVIGDRRVSGVYFEKL